MKSLNQYILESNKQKQLDIILKNNPHNDKLSDHTWIKTVDDILTWDEAYKQWQDDGGYDITPDFKIKDIEQVNKTRKITVYSSYKIKPGIFVTPSKMEAQNYGGNNSKTVKVDDIAWIELLQGQYAPIK